MARLPFASAPLPAIAGMLIAPVTPVFAQAGPGAPDANIVAPDEPTPQLKDITDADGSDAEKKSTWTLKTGGYVRTLFTAIQNDPNYEMIGRRDGFSLANVRLSLKAINEDGFGAEVSVDAAAGLPRGAGDDAAIELGVRLKDGFAFWAPHRLVRLSAGQFKAPFDAEDLMSTPALLFVQRSVGNSGQRGTEALPVEGLSQGRQVGVRLDSEVFYFQEQSDSDSAPQGPGISYALAVTNGQKANRYYNDNEKLAYFGRLNLHWGDMVQLGGAGFHNERLLGVAPDRLSETRIGWTADLSVQAYGVTLLGNIVQTEITPAPELEGGQARTARSIQTQIAYEEPFFGFQPAYRLAIYNPDVDADAHVTPTTETLTYHTIGLNYNAKDYPVRVQLNYTLTGEENVEVDNNRLDALVQVVW